MASILIKDLEVNEDLDQKALENLSGGRWVRKRFTRYIYRRITRTYRKRITYYRTYTRTCLFKVRQAYWKTVWV